MPEESSQAQEEPVATAPGETDSPRPFEVRYEMTEEDALAGYFLGFLGHPLVRRRFLPLGMFLFLTMEYGLARVAGLPAGMAVLAALVLGFGYVIPLIVRLLARKNPRIRGPHTAWITPEGIGGWTEGVGTTRVAWPLVQTVDESRHHLLIYWHVGATTLIPKKAFATPKEAESFLLQAREWHQAALQAKRLTQQRG